MRPASLRAHRRHDRPTGPDGADDHPTEVSAGHDHGRRPAGRPAHHGRDRHPGPSQPRADRRPAPAGQLLAAYRTAEAELAVPWEYLAAIHLVETRTGRIRGTSSAGAQEPMQFLPSTWTRYGRGGDTLLPEGYPTRPPTPAPG